MYYKIGRKLYVWLINELLLEWLPFRSLHCPWYLDLRQSRCSHLLLPSHSHLHLLQPLLLLQIQVCFQRSHQLRYLEAELSWSWNLQQVGSSTLPSPVGPCTHPPLWGVSINRLCSMRLLCQHPPLTWVRQRLLVYCSCRYRKLDGG